MKIKQKIKVNYSSFTNAEKSIANQILSYPKQISKMNCKDFANVANVSPSLVINFAKKINLDGWDELKYATKYAFDDDSEVNDDLLNNSLYSLQETHNNINQESLTTAVWLLHNAESIHIFSRSSSASITYSFYNRLKKVRNNVYFHSEKIEQTNAVTNLPSNAFSIYVSNSGNSTDLKNIILLDKNESKNRLLISTSENNLLSNFFIHQLIGVNIEKNYNFYKDIPLYSKMSLNYILDLIFYLYFSTNKTTCEKYLIGLKTIIDKT